MGIDPITGLPDTGINLDVTTGTPALTAPDLTPDQMAQAQAQAEAWLLQNVPATSGMTPAQALSALSTLSLSAAQIAAGLTAGTVQSAPGACPSGYKYSTGVCVPSVQPPASQSLISGISNQTLAIVGIGFLFLMMLGSGGKRR